MLLDPDFTGDTASGERHPLSGRVLDLQVEPLEDGTARANFLYDGTNPEDYELGFYLDGNLIQRVPADASEGIDLVNLEDGGHTIDSFPVMKGDVTPNRHGNEQGQRAYLEWERSTDPSTVGYRIYWDAGTGDETDQLLQEVTEMEIPTLKHNRGDSTAGRVTLWGGFTGYQLMNGSIEVTVSSDGTYTYSGLGGSGGGAWSTGQTISLPLGSWMKVEDDAEAYAGDITYSLPVGPAPRYLSGVLEPGVYNFRVVAVDQAPLESTASDLRTVRILDVPPELPGQEIAWDDDTETITLSWSPVAAVSAGILWVHVYANVSDHDGGLIAEHVNPDVPMRVVSAALGSTSFEGYNGALKVYLRPVNVAGIEREDVAMWAFSMPPAPGEVDTVLETPSDLTAAVLPNGDLQVIWSYRVRPGDQLTEFDVFVGDGEPIFDGSNLVPAFEGATEGLDEYSLDISGLADGTYSIAVRAFATDGLSTTSDVIEVVVDTVAPTAPGELWTVRQ